MNAVAAMPPAPVSSGTASTAPADDGSATPFADVLQTAVTDSSTWTGGRDGQAQSDTTAAAADSDTVAEEPTPIPTADAPAEATPSAGNTEANDLAALTAAVAAMLTGAKTSGEVTPLTPSDLAEGDQASDVDTTAPTDAPPVEGGQTIADEADPDLHARAAPATPVGGGQAAVVQATSAVARPTTGEVPAGAAAASATGDLSAGATSPAGPTARPASTTTAHAETPVIASDADTAVTASDGEPIAATASRPGDGTATTTPAAPAGSTDAAASTQPVTSTRLDGAAAPESVRESAPAPTTTAASAQVATAVAALQRRGAGIYTASIDLHPSELGQVRVEVEIRNGVINVLMSPEQGSTRALLLQQMHQLRDALQHAGLAAGSLDVASQSPQDHETSEERRTADGPHGAEVAEEEIIQRPITPSRDHHTETSVDLRV